MTLEKLLINIEHGESTVDMAELIAAGARYISVGDINDIAAQLTDIQKTILEKNEHSIAIVATAQELYDAETGRRIARSIAQRWPETSAAEQNLQLIFHESTLNAVEHGILELSSADKKSEDYFESYYAEAQKLLQKPDNASALLLITLKNKQNQLSCTITDPGEGFDYKLLKHDLDQDNQTLAGRGMNLCYQLASSAEHKFDGQHFSFNLNYDDTEIYGNALGVNPKDLVNQAKILIVDDQPVNRQLVRHFLESAGYQNFIEASDGQEGLALAQQHSPDIVLLDIMMPIMDGLEMCERLKKDIATRDIPVLFLSGLADSRTQTKGFQLGAVDYVSKPIDRNQLIARVGVHIQNGILVSKLQSYSQRVAAELSHARRVQHRLLPHRSAIEQLEEETGIKVHSTFQPSSELSGDYWHVFKHPSSNTLVFILADFTGHGISAALETFRFNSFINDLITRNTPLEDMVTELNTRLYTQLDTEQFTTLLLGDWDPATNKVRYVCHGAPNPIFIPANKFEQLRELPGGGLPLGIAPTEDLIVEFQTIHMADGDVLVMFSDALLEGKHHDGTRWMEKGLHRQISASRKKDGVMMRNLLRAFNRTAEQPLKDDLTLLTLQKVAS